MSSVQEDMVRRLFRSRDNGERSFGCLGRLLQQVQVAFNLLLGSMGGFLRFQFLLQAGEKQTFNQFWRGYETKRIVPANSNLGGRAFRMDLQKWTPSGV